MSYILPLWWKFKIFNSIWMNYNYLISLTSEKVYCLVSLILSYQVRCKNIQHPINVKWCLLIHYNRWLELVPFVYQSFDILLNKDIKCISVLFPPFSCRSLYFQRRKQLEVVKIVILNQTLNDFDASFILDQRNLCIFSVWFLTYQCMHDRIFKPRKYHRKSVMHSQGTLLVRLTTSHWEVVHSPWLTVLTS